MTEDGLDAKMVESLAFVEVLKEEDAHQSNKVNYLEVFLEKNTVVLRSLSFDFEARYDYETGEKRILNFFNDEAILSKTSDILNEDSKLNAQECLQSSS